MQITPENVESLLDNGLLFVAVGGGKWWKARRNGQTKRWKRSPGRFRIPIKAGFRETGAITESWFRDGKVIENIAKVVT